MIDRDRTLEQLEIQDWNREKFGNRVSISWKDYDNGPGFEVFCLDSVSTDSFGQNETFSVIFKAVVYFDGVRHMWWGDGIMCPEMGYINYPEMGELVPALQWLQAKAKEHATVDYVT